VILEDDRENFCEGQPFVLKGTLRYMKQEDQNLREPREDDKLEAEFHYEQNKILKWLDNYWYHYKWVTIITAFFVIVGLILVVQLVNKPKYDINFTCACSYRMNAAEYEAYEELVNKFLPEDYDGNGEKAVNIMVYEIFSEKEYEEAKSEAEANSSEFFVNAKYNADELKNFSQYSMMGESYLFMVSEHLYQQLKAGERLMPVSELYEGQDMPQGVTEDGYGVLMGQTDFYQKNSAAQVLPEDMILCVLRKAEFKQGSTDVERYNHAIDLFHAMVDYKAD